MTRTIASLTALCLAGCSLTAVSVPRPVPAELEFGRLGERTAFETGPAAEPAPGPAPAPASDGASDDDPPDSRANPEKHQRARTGVFWTGIVAIAAGGAGTVAFAATGQATQNQLGNSYDDGSLTRAKEKQLRDRGDLMNTLAIVSAAVAVIGVALAATAYGIDYTKCGKLAKRRKKCRDRGK